MHTRNIILGLLVCSSITLLVNQAFSQTRRQRSNRNQQRNFAREQQQNELEQRRQQRQIEDQMKRQANSAMSQDDSMKEALGATEEQWEFIKPKIEKVRDLRSRANTSIKMAFAAGGLGISGGFGSGGFGGGGLRSGSIVQKQGNSDMTVPPKYTNNEVTMIPIPQGWQWLKPSLHKAPGKLTEGEKICEEFLELLEDEDSSEDDIKQKMEALRKFRQDAKEELSKARQELLEVVTFRQEATLVMMRLLD